MTFIESGRGTALNIAISKRMRTACMLGGSSLALALNAPAAMAQEADASADAEENTIVVTGIRASLDRAQDIRRNSDGIVDAISAEDIGKFPDTNLAESLQRITGVSINRVNGEGGQVTVRGFSGDFNLVTLNGRTIPGADVPLAGTNRAGAGGNSRAFDFSNLASEGVNGIQVYKTGRSTVPSGGIGATVNITTARPLDNPGFNLSVGAKAVFDTSVDTGNDVTPELSGLVSWSDPSDTFGIGLFGSYQRRDSAGAAASTAGWATTTVDQVLNNTGLVNEGTDLTNTPTNGDQLIGIPFDSRYHFSEFERERLNGQLVLQFKPTDSVTITGDAVYARNDNDERRSDVSNWFGNAFTEIVFDDSPDVITPTLLATEYSGRNKDFALTQDQVGTRDELESYGLNIDWEASDSLTVVLDAHSSKSTVSPTLDSSATGQMLSRVEVGLAAPFAVAQTQTFGPDGIPMQNVTVDSSGPDGVAGFTLSDVSTTVANGVQSTRQENTIDEIDLRAIWELDENSTFTVGGNYRDQENTTDQQNFQQFLGFWNAGQPGDVAEFAPGVLEQFCLSCRFDEFDTGIADGAESGLSFRGSANDLFNTISPVYDSRDGQANDFNPDADNTLRRNGSTFSVVAEEIISVFAQFDTKFEVAEREASLSVGLRYEETDLTSTSLFNVPTAIVFSADNDNNVVNSADAQNVSVDASYSNFLPHVDISIEAFDDFMVRASYSQTLARAGFGSLVTNTSVNSLSGMTAFGAIPTASSGNPSLVPLQSDNFDLAFEWYYAPSSFVNFGVFHKRVDNFIGSGSVTQPLFGLRDVFSGQAGTRSGRALELIQGVDGAAVEAQNLYTLAILLENNSEADALAQFEASIQANGVSSLFTSLEGTEIGPDANDPELQFLVNQPLNNQQGNISGAELAVQHFFGDTGFGVAASYTYVDGNVDFDINAPVGSPQFALTGLSDTANVTLIYEKFGLSARVSYNWRDEFLSNTNYDRGNPLFVESFGQFDANISYDINENIAVSFEGINLTGANQRSFTRSRSQLVFAQELSPRYLIGARYKF